MGPDKGSGEPSYSRHMILDFLPILAPSLKLCRPLGSGIGPYFHFIILTDIRTSDIKRLRVYGSINSV